MFWFCKPKPFVVTCFTTREDVFNNAKPKKAISFLPNWFKDLKSGTFPEDPNAPLILGDTLKTCPGFIKLYASGFIFPLWCDLYLEVMGERTRYQFVDGVSEANFHPKSQLGNFPLAQSHAHIKLKNPWHIRADKNVNLTFSPPTWNDFGHGDIVVVPGVINPKDLLMSANINLLIKRTESRTIHTLLFGTPLVHVLPLTERNLVLRYELVTESELKRMLDQTPFFLMAANRYNRVKKLCSHA